MEMKIWFLIWKWLKPRIDRHQQEINPEPKEDTIISNLLLQILLVNLHNFINNRALSSTLSKLPCPFFYAHKNTFSTYLLTITVFTTGNC